MIFALLRARGCTPQGVKLHEKIKYSLCAIIVNLGITYC
ncbi:hypothetical protein APHHGE2_1150 [Anaplasma phagocytophilum str. HGE2]|nr:hypothetical protein APHWEB_1163 [Anaplasma phagocytophilum str. Webster]KJV83126.1 hypothetical protein APHHGE2_1150 [Anaplasma phagocytophilum str. HGE2]